MNTQGTKRWLLLGIVAASLSGCGSTPGEQKETIASADFAADFAIIQRVLQHPRCQNCHIPGDAPLQYDTGLTHSMDVKRGPEGKGAPGLPCATCHGVTNSPASYGQNAPPGAPNWALPPPEHKMVFINVDAPILCATLKDTHQNGGKDLDALLEHVAHDKLVLWGWEPGGNRAPVSVPHVEFVAAFTRWTKAGAPCPSA